MSALAAVGAAGGARLLCWYWGGSFFNSATGGTWTALAWDFAHGELYRPLLSPMGYGGTRYMPLLFILHGLLIRAHVDPVLAGVVVMQATVAAAVLGLYVALRSAGVSRRLALPFACTPWATVTYQKYCTDLRPDYLAAACVTAAIAAGFVAARDRRLRWPMCAGAACLVAALTKFTAIVFVAPIALALASGGSWARAARFAVVTLGAFLLLLVAIQLASAGNFFSDVRATMMAGMVVPDLWRHAIPSLLEQLVGDPCIGIPCVLAVWAIVAAARRGEWSLTESYVATTAILTWFILASPGTTSNHMVDLQMAVTLAIAVAVERGRLADQLVAPVYALLAVMMIVISVPVPGVPSPMRTLMASGPRQRATVASIRREFLWKPGVYVSADPIVPILNGDRPFVLDAFNLNLFVATGMPVGRDFAARVRGRTFSAVLLRDEGLFPRDMRPGDAGFDEAAARFWTAATPLAQLIHTTYDIRAVRKPFVVLQPAEPRFARGEN